MLDRATFETLGVRVSAASFTETLETLLQAPDAGARLAVHFATTHSLVEANRSDEVRSALGMGLVEPDGMPIVWVGRQRGLPTERVCGPDFMPALIAGGVRAGRSHFFYGGAPGVAEALAERFAALNPGLRIAGTLCPPFRDLTPEEDEVIVRTINAVRPDYVWVGLGAPKQDLWVAQHRARLDAAALLAVGAAFDMHAGTRRRAPLWMQRSGTEWLFRLAMEPRRLIGRYTITNARFLALLARDRVRRRS